MDSSEGEQLKSLYQEALIAENEVKSKLDHLDRLDKTIGELELYKRRLTHEIQSEKQFIQLAERHENILDVNYNQTKEETQKLKDQEATLATRIDDLEASNSKDLAELAKSIQDEIEHLQSHTQLIRGYKEAKKNYVLATISGPEHIENVQLD